MGIHMAQFQPQAITVIAAVLGLTLLSLPAAAQGTAEQRAACEGDAMRLCSQYIPNVQAITACMMQKRRYLSSYCRAALEGDRKLRTRRAGY